MYFWKLSRAVQKFESRNLYRVYREIEGIFGSNGIITSTDIVVLNYKLVAAFNHRFDKISSWVQSRQKTHPPLPPISRSRYLALSTVNNINRQVLSVKNFISTWFFFDILYFVDVLIFLTFFLSSLSLFCFFSFFLAPAAHQLSSKS